MNSGLFLIFSAALLLGYASRCPCYLGPVDPLKLLCVSEGVWAATMWSIAGDGASVDQVIVFWITLTLWWAAWFGFSNRYGSAYRRAIKRFWLRLSITTKGRRRSVIFVVLLMTTVTFLASTWLGGGGDNRLSVMKILRPLEAGITVLPPSAIFLLLISESRWAKPLLVILFSEMIGFGGKSAILQILLPLTGAMMVGRYQLSLKGYFGLVALIFIGYLASSLINYDSANLLGAVNLLILRVSLDGDVYLLSLANDVISQVSTSSLLNYLLGPYLKALFLPISIDENIGSQIGSILAGTDTPNGPNPHWPIVLMAYKIGRMETVVLTLLLYMIVFGLKFWLPATRRIRRAPLWFAIPLTTFSMSFPQTFFADPTFASIYLVEAFLGAVMLRIAFIPIFDRRAYVDYRHRITP